MRELRRVTRRGGRVVVGLNGADHLREMRAIIAAARGRETARIGEKLRLDSGEALLRTVFASVERHDFRAELRIPSPAPIVDYVRSMSETLARADDGQFAAAIASRAFPEGPGSVFSVTTHSGCLVAS